MERIGYNCILEIDFMKFISTKVNFPKESVIFVNLDKNLDQPTDDNVNKNWENSSLNANDQMKV